MDTEDTSSLLPGINIGVIGCEFGLYHIRGILREIYVYKLQAVSDTDQSVLDQVQEEFPGDYATYQDYRAILDDPDINAVVITLPPGMHEQVGIEAAQAGKHILMDSPIARTLEEAENIIQAASDNNVTLMVAHDSRFQPIYQKIHSLVSRDIIGRPLFAQTQHFENFYSRQLGYWRTEHPAGGGCLISSGIRNIDMMRWLFGEPDELFAFLSEDKTRLEGEIAASVLFKYASGLVVNLACHWASQGAMDHYNWDEWAMFGTEGDIAIHSDNILVGRDNGDLLDKLTPDPHEYENLWTHFARCVVNGDEPLVSGTEGKASLALVLKAYESVRTNQPVSCGD